jgi:hypothetical protein
MRSMRLLLPLLALPVLLALCGCGGMPFARSEEDQKMFCIRLLHK